VADPQPPPGICVLLERLHAGPADPEFAAARQALLGLVARRKLPSSPDRAAARKLVPDHGWYIRALSTESRWRTAETLEAIAWLIVIPDLKMPEVSEELNRWAYELDAPVPVISALSDAAQRAGDREQALMEQALCPALGQRWMAERGIRTNAVISMPAVTPRNGQAPGADHVPFWDRPASEKIALVLAVACALLIVMLAAEILR
jgi:hypothetical protein